MKIGLFLISVFFVLSLASCIQDEAPNAEADIVSVDSVWVDRNIKAGILKGKPRVSNDKVIFLIRKGVDLTSLELDPEFVLTDKATINPPNGTSRNFSEPQTYTVTSESGEWTKKYEVSFEYAKLVNTYSFEHWDYDSGNRYHTFYETPGGGPRQNIWDSGNAGYALTGMAKSADEYPTVSDDGGINGKCVRLETKTTGEFGSSVGMNLAAGNLFFGEFSLAYAVLNPLKATKFGLQIVESKPLAMKGYYKYKAGDVYTDEKKVPVGGVKDACDIYGVLYEVDPLNFVPLNGSNVLNSDRIVALARIQNAGEPRAWTQFNLPFKGKDANGEFTVENYNFDEERLEKDGYAIAIVFSSSIDGAYFRGAVGSTLYVDEVELIYQDNE